jgi:hypothetical protein
MEQPFNMNDFSTMQQMFATNNYAAMNGNNLTMPNQISIDQAPQQEAK